MNAAGPAMVSKECWGEGATSLEAVEIEQFETSGQPSQDRIPKPQARPNLIV